MGAAEQKSNRNIAIGFVIIWLIFVALVYFNLGHTNLHAAFVRAPFIANALSVIPILGALVLGLYAILSETEGKIGLGILTFILLAIGVGCAGGFNFSGF
jgi:hypothetical protein